MKNVICFLGLIWFIISIYWFFSSFISYFMNEHHHFDFRISFTNAFRAQSSVRVIIIISRCITYNMPEGLRLFQNPILNNNNDDDWIRMYSTSYHFQWSWNNEHEKSLDNLIAVLIQWHSLLIKNHQNVIKRIC